MCRYRASENARVDSPSTRNRETQVSGGCDVVTRALHGLLPDPGSPPPSIDVPPGQGRQEFKDADTFFGVELPALTEWRFGAEQAAAVRQPVLSVLGSNTAPLWIEVAEFLRDSVPDIEERTIDGVGHLLHIQRPEPVAETIADFLRRHPVT